MRMALNTVSLLWMARRRPMASIAPSARQVPGPHHAGASPPWCGHLVVSGRTKLHTKESDFPEDLPWVDWTRHRSDRRFSMRSYPRNSPQAAARVVALTVLADGTSVTRRFARRGAATGGGG